MYIDWSRPLRPPFPCRDGSLAMDDALEIRSPESQTAPLIVSSPHSGGQYPERLLRLSRLPLAMLRRLEDCFVDRLVEHAPSLGVPLVRALLARAYLDVNRHPFDLDPQMIADPPRYLGRPSARARVGLGSIPRLVGREEIYRGKLPYSEVRARLVGSHRPYHGALRRLIGRSLDNFGCALIVDCHSMPSRCGGRSAVGGGRGLDIILGDRFGAACSPAVVARAELVLRGLGYSVGRNHPFAGGYITSRYGRPADGIHVLQVEVNRALYMDEEELTPRPGLEPTSAALTTLIAALARTPAEQLAGRRRDRARTAWRVPSGQPDADAEERSAAS
jgi:N-formylglutamate amidohydrolase